MYTGTRGDFSPSFWRNLCTVFHSDFISLHPHQQCKWVSFSSYPLIVCRPFDDGHSDRCKEISHCSFELHFSNNELYWAYFHVFISHQYVFFGEMSKSSAHFLIGLLVYLVESCLSCLYILEINPLSIFSFAIIFSRSEVFSWWSFLYFKTIFKKQCNDS